MKAMTERRLLKVYLEQADFERLTGYANRENKTVSEYVREVLLSDFVAWEEADESERKKENRVPDVQRTSGVRKDAGREPVPDEPISGEPKPTDKCMCMDTYAEHWKGRSCQARLCGCTKFEPFV